MLSWQNVSIFHQLAPREDKKLVTGTGGVAGDQQHDVARAYVLQLNNMVKALRKAAMAGELNADMVIRLRARVAEITALVEHED